MIRYRSASTEPGVNPPCSIASGEARRPKGAEEGLRRFAFSSTEGVARPVGSCDMEEIACPQDGQKRASSGHGPDTGEIDPIGRCPQHPLNERTGIRSVFGENAQRLDGESSMDQRVDAFLRPRKIVKDTHRKQRDAGLDHGGNVSR